MKNEVGLYSYANQLVEKASIKDLNFLTWKTGIITFSNTPLREVCQFLSRHFEEDIVIGGESLSTLNLSVTLDNKNLEEILKIIQFTLDLDVQVIDSKIILQPK